MIKRMKYFLKRQFVKNYDCPLFCYLHFLKERR